MKSKRITANLALTPHLPEVGCRICLGCLPVLLRARHGIAFPRGLKPFAHTFVEGVCHFKAPGVPWKISLEPGEAEYLARQRRTEKVPF